jgi:uncharacterized membrane protein
LKSSGLSQSAGVLSLGVFAVNVYLGIYDTNLASNAPHYYANWLIAIVTLVAAVLLLVRPANRRLVMFAGVLWPILYALALTGDVYTRLCTGVSAESCWPSKTAAFDYLVLNQATIKGAPGYGWKLAPVMPFAILLLVLVFLLSVLALTSTHATDTQTPMGSQPAPAPPAQA